MTRSMRFTISTSTTVIDAMMEQLDTLGVDLGLPAGAGFAATQTAVFAILASAERDCGCTAAPFTPMERRVQHLGEALSTMGYVHRARRVVVGIDPGAEARFNKAATRIEDAMQVGRTWQRLLELQAGFRRSCRPVDVSQDLVGYADGDDLGAGHGLEDLISVPEAELV